MESEHGDSRLGPTPQPEPRDWHWAFAHTALREIVFEQTDKLLAGLANPARIDGVPAAVMRRVAQVLSVPEADLAAHAGGIRVHLRLAGILPVYLFEMPAPMAPTEAHWVAVVNQFTRSPRMAYYTLEAAQGGGTALCSWDAAGVHLNLGSGPPPALDDFLAELVVRLQSPGMPDADGADPAEAAAQTLDGTIGRDNLSRDHLLALLERTGFDVSASGEGGILMRDSGLVCMVTVPERSREYVSLHAWWNLREDSSRIERLECANRINNEYLFIRASIDGDGSLCLARNVAVHAGISTRHLVSALRNFTTACREAVREHANDLLG